MRTKDLISSEKVALAQAGSCQCFRREVCFTHSTTISILEWVTMTEVTMETF